MTRTRLSALALITLAGSVSLPSAFGQQSTPPGPAKVSAKPGQSSTAPAAATAARTVTLVPERPGTYSYWVVGTGSGQGSVATLTPGDASARVALRKDAVAIEVLDETTGLSAVKPVAEAKNGATVKVTPGDFTLVRAVVINVTANGKPVEKASVEIKDARGTTKGRVLTAADGGQARFENVALGKAAIRATYGANNSEAAKQETNIVPAKGGGPVAVTLALSGNVPTLDAAPAPPAGASAGAPPGAPTIVVQPPAPQPEPRNDWVSGIIGILMLVGGTFFGMRYLKNRGMTVQDAIQSGLKSVGAEMPQDAPGANGAHLKPAAPSLPPLPSLHDLPPGGAAAPSVTLAGTSAAVAAPVNLPGSGPRLIGMAGAVSGEVVNLETDEVTVGRDPANTLPLPQDTTVSRRHARFAPGGSGDWEVVDEGSSNGTYVNGRKTDRQTLQPGDEVQIGSARFRFEV